jgi:hypothetical protein
MKQAILGKRIYISPNGLRRHVETPREHFDRDIAFAAHHAADLFPPFTCVQ